MACDGLEDWSGEFIYLFKGNLGKIQASTEFGQVGYAVRNLPELAQSVGGNAFSTPKLKAKP